jgi:hypothetical protein
MINTFNTIDISHNKLKSLPYMQLAKSFSRTSLICSHNFIRNLNHLHKSFKFLANVVDDEYVVIEHLTNNQTITLAEQIAYYMNQTFNNHIDTITSSPSVLPIFENLDEITKNELCKIMEQYNIIFTEHIYNLLTEQTITQIHSLYCSYNNLENLQLDVKNTLDCSYNKLKYLKANPITNLNCSHNKLDQIESFNVGFNTKRINCSHNFKLSQPLIVKQTMDSLNISHTLIPNLQPFKLSNNKISFIFEKFRCVSNNSFNMQISKKNNSTIIKYTKVKSARLPHLSKIKTKSTDINNDDEYDIASLFN